MKRQRVGDIQVVSTGAALGAEVRGLDLTQPMDEEVVDFLQDKWDEHLVLLYRNQKLTPGQLLGVSCRFGALRPPGINPYGKTIFPEYPLLNRISNIKDEKGEPIGNLGAGPTIWHADMTYIQKPPKGCVLYAVETPRGQGQTSFANMFAAYEALPDETKRRLLAEVAVHDESHNSTGMLREGYVEVEDVRKTPGYMHPLVCTHPRTGKDALFLGRRPHSYIPGWDVEKSDALLDKLWEHATKPEFVWRHEWEVGDLLMWENLWTLHQRDTFDPGARRLMHRAQIRGDWKPRKTIGPTQEQLEAELC